MTDGETPQTTVLDDYKMAQAARDRGDLAAARAHLNAGLSRVPAEEAPVWLKLLEAEILNAEGRSDVAKEVWRDLHARHPGNLWPIYHLATQALHEGDLVAARAYFDATQAIREISDHVWLRLLEADLLRGESRETDAKSALEQAVHVFPRNIWLHHRLGQIAEDRGDYSAAREHFEAALEIDDSNLSLHLSIVRLMTTQGDTDAAIQRLEMLRQRHPRNIHVLLGLARAYNAAGRLEDEQGCLSAAIDANPLDRTLLRYLFATRARSADLEELQMVSARIRATVDNNLADELLISSQLQAMQFEGALKAIRSLPKARRSPAEARNLANALFGAHHDRLGLRYLRFCMRRWPGDQGLWAVYVPQTLKHGQFDELEQRLDQAARHLPRHLILGHRLALSGFRNDLDEAVRCYAELRELGQDRFAHRAVLAKLIYTSLDPMAADALFERIGNPGAEDVPLLHRGGLIGLMTLEFELECRALADMGGYTSLSGWVKARPDSTIAAVRLVDAWCAEPGEPEVVNAAAPIPRQVFQYWDNPDPPEALAPMVTSWSAVPGFGHQLMDRIDALRFLRDNMGKDWLRAFQLAQNAAQEADLLRLCLLMQRGGIWADADDHLYGDLDSLLRLDEGRGLILYREAQGGALGNNFMAAAPRHPVVMHAANLACQALLQRANENAWNKTGPGLLTRALAHYLVKAGFTEARRRVTILDWPVLTRQISVHNPVPDKKKAGYWNNAGVRTSADLVWDRFLTVLQARSGSSARDAAGGWWP